MRMGEGAEGACRSGMDVTVGLEDREKGGARSGMTWVWF